MQRKQNPETFQTRLDRTNAPKVLDVQPPGWSLQEPRQCNYHMLCPANGSGTERPANPGPRWVFAKGSCLFQSHVTETLRD